MGGMVSLWGASSLVQSVQYVTISLTGTTTGTGTIVAVDTARAVVLLCGSLTSDTTQSQQRTPTHVVLTNSTTVTATRLNPTTNIDVNVVVVEFAPGVVKLIQAVIITVSAASTSNTAALTECNTGKTILVYNGTTFDNDDNNSCWARFSFTSTVLTLQRNGSSNQVISRASLLEFF